jgi:hypothetical protein
MEELFQSGSIGQNRSSANWPLAKILQRYMNHVTQRLGLKNKNTIKDCLQPNPRTKSFSERRNYQCIDSNAEHEMGLNVVGRRPRSATPNSRLQLHRVPAHTTHSAKVIEMITTLNHVPVHRTHSAQVIEMITTLNHVPVHRTLCAKVIEMITTLNHVPVHRTHSAQVIEMITTLNHVPVHRTHSAQVIEMITTLNHVPVHRTHSAKGI